MKRTDSRGAGAVTKGSGRGREEGQDGVPRQGDKRDQIVNKRAKGSKGLKGTGGGEGRREASKRERVRGRRWLSENPRTM